MSPSLRALGLRPLASLMCLSFGSIEFDNLANLQLYILLSPVCQEPRGSFCKELFLNDKRKNQARSTSPPTAGGNGFHPQSSRRQPEPQAAEDKEQQAEWAGRQNFLEILEQQRAMTFRGVRDPGYAFAQSGTVPLHLYRVVGKRNFVVRTRCRTGQQAPPPGIPALPHIFKIVHDTEVAQQGSHISLKGRGCQVDHRPGRDGHRCAANRSLDTNEPAAESG